MIRSVCRRRYDRNAMLTGTLVNSFPFSRNFSNVDDDTSKKTTEWRKASLDQLEQRFAKEPARRVNVDEDLQPEWKAMESRVVKRRTLTLDQVNGKIGRANIRQTEEDIWMESGLYDEDRKN